MIRIIGLILCASSAVLGGFYIGERCRRRASDSTFVRDLAEHLKREMYYSHTELPECFSSFPDEKRASFLDLLVKGSYREALKSLKLTPAFSGAFLRFLENLGKSGLQEELSAVGKFSEYAQKEADKWNSQLKNDVKKSRVLGICIAAAIILLFL